LINLPHSGVIHDLQGLVFGSPVQKASAISPWLSVAASVQELEHGISPSNPTQFV
jgi:hypothetical protein